MGKKWKQWQILFSWAPKIVDSDCSLEIKRCLLLGRKAMTNLNSIFHSRDITLLTKIGIVKAMVFPVVMYRCENMWEICWAQKDWCFSTVVLEKSLESPLDSKEIKPVNSKGNQPWIFIGKTDAEVEAPIIWPPDGKSCLIRKDPDARKYWGQEKRATEGNMVGWHHWLGHESEQTPRDSEGQGSLAGCSPWGRKELEMK